jgi:hypothetical protein
VAGINASSLQWHAKKTTHYLLVMTRESTSAVVLVHLDGALSGSYAAAAGMLADMPVAYILAVRDRTRPAPDFCDGSGASSAAKHWATQPAFYIAMAAGLLLLLTVAIYVRSSRRRRESEAGVVTKGAVHLPTVELPADLALRERTASLRQHLEYVALAGKRSELDLYLMVGENDRAQSPSYDATSVPVLVYLGEGRLYAPLAAVLVVTPDGQGLNIAPAFANRYDLVGFYAEATLRLPDGETLPASEVFALQYGRLRTQLQVNEGRLSPIPADLAVQDVVAQLTQGSIFATPVVDGGQSGRVALGVACRLSEDEKLIQRVFVGVEPVVFAVAQVTCADGSKAPLSHFFTLGRDGALVPLYSSVAILHSNDVFDFAVGGYEERASEDGSAGAVLARSRQSSRRSRSRGGIFRSSSRKSLGRRVSPSRLSRRGSQTGGSGDEMLEVLTEEPGSMAASARTADKMPRSRSMRRSPSPKRLASRQASTLSALSWEDDCYATPADAYMVPNGAWNGGRKAGQARPPAPASAPPPHTAIAMSAYASTPTQPAGTFPEPPPRPSLERKRRAVARPSEHVGADNSAYSDWHKRKTNHQRNKSLGGTSMEWDTSDAFASGDEASTGAASKPARKLQEEAPRRFRMSTRKGAH